MNAPLLESDQFWAILEAMANEVSLEFVARQLERVLDRLGAIEGQLAALNRMATRRDKTVDALHDDFQIELAHMTARRAMRHHERAVLDEIRTRSGALKIDSIDWRRAEILAQQDKPAAKREKPMWGEAERWRSRWLQLAVSTVLAAAVAAIVSRRP